MLISRSILSLIAILLTFCNVTNSFIGEYVCATKGCTSCSHYTEEEEQCQGEIRLFPGLFEIPERGKNGFISIILFHQKGTKDQICNSPVSSSDKTGEASNTLEG